MEQKSMFKRLLSFVVVFTMLFSSFVVLAAPAFAADEAVDAGKYNAGLNIELSDNEQLLNIDDAAAIKLLTDGDWALNAEAWGGNTNGVVLVQNKNATQQNAWGQANFIWKFEDTPDPYNNIKFGFYSDVNSMIGYPTEEDVWFSNNGVDWVSGYSTADIGYGETIPDAMTKFDGEATPAGTVVGEIKLRNPQTYKYVKIEFYYPKSPFTEENGYTNGTAKPRWEFFGLTEVFDFDLVPTSTVVTDWNAHQYWEGRGGSNGSYAFNNAEDYAASSLTWWKHVAFAPVEGEENTYTIAGIRAAGADSLLAFPEGGFVWCAWNDAGTGTPGKAALNLFGTMAVGDVYVLTGFDVAGAYVQNDATITKWVDPDAPVNVALGSSYEISLAPSSSYVDTDNKELTDGFRVNGKYNEPGWVGVILNGTNRSFDVVVTLGDGEKAYNISEIIVNAGAAGTSAGVTEPELATFYSVDGTEWFEFGSYAATGTADACVNASMTVETPVEAKFVKVTVSKEQGKGNLMWLGEIEVYGVEAEEESAKGKLTIVLGDGVKVLNSDVDSAIDLLTDGNFALDAGAWGTNTSGVVAIQNPNPANVNSKTAADLIWEFGETPEAYNTIRFGIYSDANVMIGYPTEDDVYFSNDGITWISGYSKLGYGETLLDTFATFEDNATAPGAIIGEIRLENPQTYKYVKISLQFPKSPFTVDNGYTSETAKPRWEFIGLTEAFEFDYVEPSSVITDFNVDDYWESRYGRGAGSFAFTTAEEYKVAWDNFITSSYTQVAFAPVADVENTYEVVVIGNSELTFPEGGFIWTAYNSAEAGSAAEAAINLFKSMTVGDQYTFTGIDFEKGFGEKDAKVEKYEAPVEDVPFWSEGEYELDATGNWNPYYSWNYVFTIDSFNSTTGAATAIFDNATDYAAKGPGKWTTQLVLAPVAGQEGVYEVIAAYKTTGKTAQANLDDGTIDFNDGKIVLSVQDSGTRPEKNDDGTLKFPNWEDRAASWGLMNTLRAKVTLNGDTLTVEDKPNPVISGWGADVNVMTDGYNGVGEVTGWEGNQDKIYGFSNNLLVKAEYDFTIAIEETEFDAITLYALDYANGGVFVPTSVKFVVGENTYDAVITANENGIATITAELTEAITASEIKVLAVMGASPYSFAIFNMFTELEVREYVEPVGTKENPAVIEIMPGMRGYMGEGYATLKGGDEYYFTAIVPVDGNVNANFYVIDAEYNGYNVLYSLNGGELLDNYNYDNPGLDNLKAGDVVTIYVKVSDEAPDVDLTAMISLDAVGSMSNPEEIEAGEYTAEIGAGNWSGYNYEFVAEKDGYVMITVADDNAGWVYSISNVSAGIYGDMHYSDDETLVKTDWVKVLAGETATINVSTYGGATTEGTVKFTVKFVPDVESFWTEEEDGRTTPDGNYDPAHAWGYVFTIDTINSTSGAATAIFDNATDYAAKGPGKWTTQLLLAPVAGQEGVYAVIAGYVTTGKNAQANLDDGTIDFNDGKIVLSVQDSGTRPEMNEDGTLKFPNWEERAASWGLLKTIGAKMTYDKDANTLTVEDKPVGKITQWTGGADISVLTDGYTGVGEVTGYEGNGDKLYGLGNDILFETEYSFDVSLGYTAFDSITLYALDYANGGVMLPKSVEFVVNGESYEGTITANENGIATITADLWTEVRASSITVNAVMGASPYTFPIFNMFTELAVNEIEYTTSKVVTDFNPVSYKQSFGGANGAFIYDDPNVYATAGIDWWIHVLFAPTEMDGIYEVKAVRAPQTGNYLTLEWGNFVWAAWSSAGDTPDSAGAFALDFMGKLSVGDKVEFTGVDFFMQTTEADATAEKWIDPNAPVNVALNKTYEISGIGNRGSYYGSITDGSAVMNLGGDKDKNWFGFYHNGNAPTNAPDKVGYFIIDLEKAYDVNNIRVGLIKNDGWGIAAPASVKAYGSVDGTEFTEIGTFEFSLVDGEGVWTEIDAEATARYIKIEVTLASTFAFVNEVEVYGEEAEIPVAKDKLTIELSDNDTILGKTTDEAIDLLTDGDWVLDAGAWGTGTENVVLFQNKNATDSGAYGQINIIYEFAETPEPYNNIKLGLYSDVNSMIGYPSEEDIFFSNDGINWVGGYSNASIGYGETIPDAMTKFDGEATPAGTVIAELKLRVPQTYKFVKIEFYFPKSPFTVDNGYAPEAAKPRWEFFGVTEYEIGYVEPSSVITDFNIDEYWESRYGRGCGSFAFTTAEEYKVAWDNFITSSYTQVAFAPVEGVENTYEVVVIGNSELTFPEGGFIWTAYNSATADSPAEAAINLFATMTVGDQYTFTGIDFEKGFGEKDAKVEKYEAPVVEKPDVVELLVSHVNLYNWGTFESMIISGDGKTVEEVIGQKPQWWIVYVVENIDGKYVATRFLKNSEECYTVKVPEGGFLYYVFDANSAYAAADEEALLGYTFVLGSISLEGTTAIDTTLQAAKVLTAYAPGVEIPEPVVTSKVVNAFNPGHYSEGSEAANGAYIFTDAAKYGDGSGFAWWRHAALAPVEGTDGLFEVIAITSGTEGTSGKLAIPEGGFIWVAFEWPEGAETSGTYALNVMNTLAVGDKVQFTGLDIANLTTTADATAVKYEEPKPVISGWGADVSVMTDGYTGLGEMTGWEGNQDKIYGFSNNLLVKAEYDFTIAITETKFDAITLYALDYANGGVMLPESVKFVVGDKTYDAVITANENGIATIKAELGETVTASEIKVLVVMGESPYTFAIFNMFTELTVNVVEDKPEALLGDVNGNGEIEMYDYILVKRQIMNTIELTDDQKAVADVNGNGEIDMYDYILIKRHIMGTFVIGE